MKWKDNQLLQNVGLFFDVTKFHDNFYYNILRRVFFDKRIYKERIEDFYYEIF